MLQSNFLTYKSTEDQQKLTESTFKVGEIMTTAFLTTPTQTTATAIAYNNQQLHATYTENFDLSFLPQDCDTASLNIPTTVYQYRNNTSTTPEIKIEQTWQNCDQVNQEAFSPYYQSQVQTKTTNQLLIPQNPYSLAYPSPQSSPAQSEYCFPPTQSLSSSQTSLYASSPCPSIDAQSIKQELHILPPSPPESNCEVPSPHTDVKSEPIDADVDYLSNDWSRLITQQQQKQDTNELAQNQELREYLEDNNFEKKLNLKSLALDSFIGNLEAVRGDIEPVISLALQHAKREADETCRQLQISHDPSFWTPAQVHAWLQSTIAQFKLPQIENLSEKFVEDGAALVQLSEEEFARRAPEVSNK